MSYSYEIEFDTRPTHEIAESIRVAFEGASLTATATVNGTADKITVSGGQGIEGSTQYAAEMTRSKLAAIGVLAHHHRNGAKRVLQWGSNLVAEVHGENIAVYL